MDIQTEKIRLTKKLLETNSMEVIQAVDTVFRHVETDNLNEITPKNNPALPNHTLTDDELLDIIFESKEQIKNGNSYTMEEMKQRIESWKKK